MKARTILCSVLFTLFAHLADATELNISVTKTSLKGTIYIAIYNNPADFGKPDKAYRKIVISAAGDPTTTRIANLPSGDYAFAVYQDENNNRKIDKNIIGIPTEPFCFSNNYRPIISAPSFNDCKFHLDGEKSLSVRLLRY
jgi:uncharacterized protein (DUF2141 family)